MKSYSIILIAFILLEGFTIEISNSSVCSSCSELKSQSDCVSGNQFRNCSWQNDTCVLIAQPGVKSYCETLKEPEKTCYKTKGCAFIDGVCTHFTGCTAYVKTTQDECQSISSSCISNGITCEEVQPCNKYSIDVCEKYISSTKPYKCIVENQKCREYKCQEADSKLQTNQVCDEWKSGCLTTGYGCIDVVPNCQQYTGTQETCNKMIGKDGKCSSDSSDTDQKCKLRICSEAKLNLYNNLTCGDYKKGCLSTGFSCVEILSSCSTYEGNEQTCLTYIGSEGNCTVDESTIKCRLRKCDDLISSNLIECQKYLPECVTDGAKCVKGVRQCDGYKGTTKTCLNFKGIDGFCKGTSETDENSDCTLKDCFLDSQGTETTDSECQLIQSYCKTTGSGCLTTLKKCSEYSNEGKCKLIIASDGQCWDDEGEFCKVKQCTDNTTATTNQECWDFITGCVTNGAGCVNEIECEKTHNQLSCEGSIHNECYWEINCVGHTCVSQATRELCVNELINEKKCIWKNDKCQDFGCIDLQFKDDDACNQHMGGCVTNGETCANPNNCNEFKGNMTKCRNYKSNCTNINDNIDMNTPCIQRTCLDDNIIATQDSDCKAYLSDCYFAGVNKCQVSQAYCWNYTGSSIDQCKQFTGYNYLDVVIRVQCWYNSHYHQCTNKICALAEGMKNDDDCNKFLIGCLYNGLGSCLLPDYDCTSYYYQNNKIECSQFKKNYNNSPCLKGSQTNNNDYGSCRMTQCYDAPLEYNSNSQCESFKSGCLTHGAGCYDPKQNCQFNKGTSETCGKIKSQTGIPCTRVLKFIEPIKDCSTKTNSKSNKDCMIYQSNCVLTYGTTNCQDAELTCTNYKVANNSNQDKATYCNSVKTKDGTFCGYNSSETTQTCVARQCQLWNSTLGIPCEGYAGPNTCRFTNNYCYLQSGCDTYKVSSENGIEICQNIKNNKNQRCAYNKNNNYCKSITECEEVYSPQVQDDCYIQSRNPKCVLIGTKCVTIKQNCQDYQLTSIETASKSSFCGKLKSLNNGIITNCKYITSQCQNDICENIANPTSQTNCNVLPGCKYYSQKCYTITQCSQYQLSSTISDSEKNKFCQNMYNLGSTEFCSYNSSTPTNCGDPKSCIQYDGLTSSEASENLKFCNSKRDKNGTICNFAENDTKCSIANGSLICTLISSGITQDNECDLFTKPLACKTDNNGGCVLRDNCTSTTPTTGSEIIKCQNITASDGFYCSFQSDTTTCIVSKDDCAGWIGTNIQQCQIYIDKYGNQCTYHSGSNCSNKTCEDSISPKTQLDCDLISSGCIFYNQQCLQNKDSCTEYTFPDSINTNDLKFTYCNGRISNSDQICTYINESKNCVNAAEVSSCTNYQAIGEIEQIKKDYCQQILTIDNTHCIYQIGDKCTKIADLGTEYQNYNCEKLFDSVGRQCIGIKNQSKCQYYECDAQCEAEKQCNKVQVPQNSGNWNYCSNTTVQIGVKCFGYGVIKQEGPVFGCFARTCYDTHYTIQFATNEDCQSYSPLCKLNIRGCSPIYTDCSEIVGDITQSSYFIDSSGENYCQSPGQAQDFDFCSEQDCRNNVSAQSQAECDKYIPNGGCKWRNPGCLSSYESCESYLGTAEECAKFVVNGFSCKGISDARQTCTHKQCQEPKNETECKQLGEKCFFTGRFCINASEIMHFNCSDFYGTEEFCKSIQNGQCFLDLQHFTNGKGICYDKECSLFKGTSNEECQNYLHSCFYNGIECIWQEPKKCSDYKGNTETCFKLISKNEGPCKASKNSVALVDCAPRNCQEAPESFTTDQQCKDYTSNCRTTGKGCQSQVFCKDYVIDFACQANSSCSWNSYCRAPVKSCSSLSQEGKIVCLNYPKMKCIWEDGQGKPENAKCRDILCSDYEITLTSHQECQSISNNLCTTTGAGCVNFSTCNTYKSASICSNASTTELTKRCIWENGQCRQFKCSDFQGSSNYECNNKLNGCKSNGIICIGPNYECSVFNEAGTLCLTDSNGYACLYVNGKCYKYEKCTDIVQPTYELCQSISPNCVVGIDTCIPLNQCGKYQNQISCKIGIKKTICGWLPTQQCSEFTKCSDATGTTFTDCAVWNDSCVSDGTNCISIGECASYLTQYSCEGNYDQNKNACFWNENTCRLKQCQDIVAMTDSECLNNIVKEGLCTTDGTKCVIRNECTQYLTQASCTIGIDGTPCVYSYSLGQTTGTQSCRIQDCTDILGISNDQCQRQTNIQQCVSNGMNCINKGKCQSYKNEVSCYGGGTDYSKCAFRQVSAENGTPVGTCIPFTLCVDAYGDQITCESNPSCKYHQDTKKCKIRNCKTQEKCNHIPSFDGKSYTLCIFLNNNCQNLEPSSLTQGQCYSIFSDYSYTWNSQTLKCQSCKGQSQTNNSYEFNDTNSTLALNGLKLSFYMTLVLIAYFD